MFEPQRVPLDYLESILIDKNLFSSLFAIIFNIKN